MTAPHTSTSALPGSAEIAALRARHPGAFGASPAIRARRWAAAGAVAAFIVFGLWWVGFSAERIWNGLFKLGWLFQFLFPPSHGGWLLYFLEGMGETLAMAFLGTLLAALGAIPLGFLAARNIVSNRFFHFGVRRSLDGLRGVDALIWALVFVSAVGLGPFAGVMALAMSDVGTLAKLFSEAIENVEREQSEGVRAAGADRATETRFGILPQVLPIFVSNVLYYFESNTRSATVLGVVGAGGIGLALSDRIRINDWDQVCFIVIMILVTVSIIDLLSRILRERLVGKQPLPA
ncbi:MAG: phosphonate ABC transporter, permease protein PhnE [Azospirillum sp.]|nr:phosphonate ABC transporter, permease protein PhnE [Azospirillum sp.]MCZ8124949.1 phosphonate ABC transporter, permease protein PhnE [Magnetospirillum sp.]